MADFKKMKKTKPFRFSKLPSVFRNLGNLHYFLNCLLINYDVRYIPKGCLSEVFSVLIQLIRFRQEVNSILTRRNPHMIFVSYFPEVGKKCC